MRNLYIVYTYFFNYHFGNRNYESITKIVPFLFSKCFLERHVHTMLRVKEQERELVREVVPQQRVKSSVSPTHLELLVSFLLE